MLHGVLDERLEQQRRQQSPRRAVADVPGERQVAGMARFQDLGVATQPGDLLVEGLHLCSRRYRIAEKVAEVADQLTGLARVLGHQARDGVQRVEQEMRLEV